MHMRRHASVCVFVCVLINPSHPLFSFNIVWFGSCGLMFSTHIGTVHFSRHRTGSWCFWALLSSNWLIHLPSWFMTLSRWLWWKEAVCWMRWTAWLVCCSDERRINYFLGGKQHLTHLNVLFIGNILEERWQNKSPVDNLGVAFWWKVGIWPLSSQKVVHLVVHFSVLQTQGDFKGCKL